MKRLLIAFVLVLLSAVAASGFYVWREAAGVAATDLEDIYLTSADRFVDVKGLNVRVREQGPEGAPVILLMHGFIFSLETWNAWADMLSDDFRVVRFDLAGHGLTGPDPLERYAPDERADFVGDVMDALGIDTAIIGGNSLGGLAAWKFAAEYPARVRALILAAPGAYSVNGVSDTPVEAPAPMKAFLLTAPEAGVAATLANIFHDERLATPERITRVRDMMRREGNGAAFLRSIEEFVLPDPTLALSSISVPTLILWGREDTVLPFDHAGKMASTIPGAQLIAYDGVGHVVQEEAPEKSGQDVIDFLQRIDAINK